jgi:hypothetical protein
MAGGRLTVSVTKPHETGPCPVKSGKPAALFCPHQAGYLSGDQPGQFSGYLRVQFRAALRRDLFGQFPGGLRVQFAGDLFGYFPGDLPVRFPGDLCGGLPCGLFGEAIQEYPGSARCTLIGKSHERRVAGHGVSHAHFFQLG